MLVGLEYYLGMDELPPSPSSGDFYPESDISSSGVAETSFEPAVSELPEGQRLKVSQMTSNDLMMLLSGNQKAKKNTKKPKESPPSTSDDQMEDEIRHSSFAERTEPRASSQERSIQSIPSVDAIAALEERIFSSVQSISALNLLHRPSSKSLEEPEVILVEDPVASLDAVDCVAALEKNMGGRSVNARKLFLSFEPKSVKNKKGQWTLKVRLKISPVKLAAVKPRPLVASGAPTFLVTLLVPTAVLKELQRKPSPLLTRCSGSKKGKNAKDVFAMMMKTATLNAVPKLTELQKLHGIEPPPIKKDHLHVCEDEVFPDRFLAINIPLRKKSPIVLQIESMDSLMTTYTHRQEHSTILYLPVFEKSLSIDSLIASNAPLACKSAAHQRIADEYVRSTQISSHLPWPQKFQPPNIGSLLLCKESREFLETWILNSFAILQSKSTRTPRNVRKREQIRRQKRKLDPMADFIDDGPEDEDTEEDNYQPVLIIEGEAGSGKTAAVYAAMSALDGYVYEINSGQQRSRKDLLSSLREFCTTRIIHQNQEEHAFQKGLVLFEDCDVLFEQDKSFWTVVLEVINYSRRPIVLTVQDCSVIPKPIWDMAVEQGSNHKIRIDDKDALCQYLWLCCLSHKCIVSSPLLSRYVDECLTSTGFDVRKALMKCQLLCSGRLEAGTYTQILLTQNSEELMDLTTQDLNTVAQLVDTLSVSDIIQQTPSLFLHDPVCNELLGTYIIDHSHLLRQDTLPYELNIGRIIRDMIPDRGDYKEGCSTFNEIRIPVLEFLSSRAKKVPHFLQDVYRLRVQTRSGSSSEGLDEPETQGLSDTSTSYSMLKLAFLMDLAPFARDWAHFQKSLEHYEAHSMSPNNSLREFIGWRPFLGDLEDVLRTISKARSQ